MVLAVPSGASLIITIIPYSNPKSIVVGVIHELPLPSGLNLKKYDNSNRIAIAF